MSDLPGEVKRTEFFWGRREEINYERILMYKRSFCSRLLLFTFNKQKQNEINLWQGSFRLILGKTFDV